MGAKIIRFILFVALAFTLFSALFSQAAIYAQGEPTAIIDTAYRDLSQQLGVTIPRSGSLRRPTTYTWSDEEYVDASLDCPAPGMNYTKGPIAGFRITISYGGSSYDYRAKADGTLVFQCTANKRAPGGQLNPPTALPATANNSVNTNVSTTGQNVNQNSNVSIQSATAPLLLHVKGDIWSLHNQTLLQQTEWGFNQPAILSPDGLTIAYASSAKLVVDLIKAGQMLHSSSDPTNIWLLTIASGKSWRIMDQPAGAAILGNYVIRSQPSWSPDGKALAWTELPIINSTASSYRLVIYMMDTASASIAVPDLGGVANPLGFAPMPVQWGEKGIAVLAATSAAGVQAGSTINTYDLQGKLLSKSSTLQGINNIVWIRDGNQEYIAAMPTDTRLKWQLVDPLTGVISPINGVQERYSLHDPSGMLVYPLYADGQDVQWIITFPSKNNMKLLANITDPGLFLDNIAISPDATQAAFIGSDGVIIVDSTGKSTAIGRQDATALLWGATGWRIRKN